jgi:hypothetical protein
MKCVVQAMKAIRKKSFHVFGKRYSPEPYQDALELECMHKELQDNKSTRVERVEHRLDADHVLQILMACFLMTSFLLCLISTLYPSLVRAIMNRYCW